jgi:hypothetical protein
VPVLTPRRAPAGLPSFPSQQPYCGGYHVASQAQKPYRYAPCSDVHSQPQKPRHHVTTSPRTDVYHDSLPIRHRHAGGVDLGLRSQWAAAPPLPDGTPQVAEFDTYTDGLEAIADWLQQRGITTFALEATGVSWEPCSPSCQNAAST